MQNKPPEMLFRKSYSYKLCNIRRKTTVLESLFAKLLRTPMLMNPCTKKEVFHYRFLQYM